MTPDFLLNQAAALHKQGKLAEAEKLYRQILTAEPGIFQARYLLAVLLYQKNSMTEALQAVETALKLRPQAIEALSLQGVILQAAGRREEALASFSKLVTLKPDYAEGWYNRGIVLRDLMRFEEAATAFHKVLGINPDNAEAWNNYAVVLQNLMRFEEALTSFDRALALKHNHIDALYNRGIVLQDLNRAEEALVALEKVLAIRSNHAEAWNNYGVTLHSLARFEEALSSYDKALALKADYAAALNNRAITLRKLNRFEEALASVDSAISIDQGSAKSHYNRGVVLSDIKRDEEALASYDKALTIKPNYIEALTSRGIALQNLKRFEEALNSLEKALAIDPNDVETLNNRGNIFQEMKRFEEALECYDKLLKIEPDHSYALNGMAYSALSSCDWTLTGALLDELTRKIVEETSDVNPFVLLGYSDDASLQLKCAKQFSQNSISHLSNPLWNGTAYRHSKIRIAYISSDFRLMPMATVITELFELHDRSRFEVLGISSGADDGSKIRDRLTRSVDQFIDIQFKNDREVAELLNQREVDILIDLNGHTRGARTEILSYRPAPVQVNYMGFPGTMGLDFVDYIIADKTVLPFDQQPFFTEKIVHLPDSYWVNDSKRAVSEKPPTRTEAGLPEQGFVFCSFNNCWKFSAPMFDIWMRLLESVSGSVLWLLADNASARKNLRLAASSRGIDPQRLIFADRVASDDHLARHRLADLFLDTLPYNAHTTACDALLMGTPLVTCKGKSFASRVAASLLHATGLQELVTENLEDYEALALRLARDPSLLNSLRQKLEQNKKPLPLFDTDRFRQNIETAYARMLEISERGDLPESFGI